MLSAGGRRPVRRVTRRRVRGSSDLTLPCKLERERGSSCHARPVPRPAVCGRRPSRSPFCPGDGEGKGRLLHQQPHRRGPGRVGPAPCTAAGVRGAKNGGLLGHRPCPQTARGGRRHTGPPLEPGLRAAFRGCTDSKPGALRAPRPPGGASGRARRGGSPHHGHLWCDAVPGLAGPRSGCEPGSQLGAAPGFRMLHQYGFRAPAPKTRERASAYRVTRAERVPLLHPGVRAPRGPLQRRGRQSGCRCPGRPRASSPLGVSPRISPPPSARRRHGDPRALEPN